MSNMRSLLLLPARLETNTASHIIPRFGWQALFVFNRRLEDTITRPQARLKDCVSRERTEHTRASRRSNCSRYAAGAKWYC